MTARTEFFAAEPEHIDQYDHVNYRAVPLILEKFQIHTLNQLKIPNTYPMM